MIKGNKTQKQQTGAIGESIAERFLQSKGYTILTRNYRKPWGEIDIIGEKGGIVRFVEVKTVSLRSFLYSHNPEELVDLRKLRKVARTAALYMEAQRDGREYQIDVVGVIMDTEAKTAHCRLLEQALDGEWE